MFCQFNTSIFLLVIKVNYIFDNCLYVLSLKLNKQLFSLRNQQLDIVFYFATVLIPELESNTSLKKSFTDNFDELFSGLEDDSQQKLGLLVSLISALCFAYTFRRIGKLTYFKRKKFVDQLFSFPIAKVVGGVSGLKSLCFISFYGIEEVWKTIKYEGPRG